MSANPFLGAQPYRAADRDRFFGREELTQRLANHVLVHSCVTLFGESGAGKSSLMQAGVIPHLEEAHGFRTVRIDGWLAGESPLERLVQALFQELALGPLPEGLESTESIDLAVELARQQSPRPILIYLDQLEQLFLPGRASRQTEALLESLEALARKPIRGLQLVLALREDYLGRFRERARGRRKLLEQGFRLGPLTVAEMARVACQIAASGSPGQPWREDELRELMVQVRTPGQDPTEDAEVQAAFAQIVCRALWEQRVYGGEPGLAEAEKMLHQYLDATLEGLGPLKESAQRLLEKHLIDSEGSRVLLMEETAGKALEGLSGEDATRVLGHLQAAAVLHATEHQGSRYFELGHDWLARKVLELRQEREKEEQEEERLQQERVEQERREQEVARKLREERAGRRKLAVVASGAVVVAVMMALVMLWALGQQREAEVARVRARDQALMAGAREQMGRGSPDLATHLLLEVKRPEQVRGWEQLALDALMTGVPMVTLRCHDAATAASFSPDGARVAVGCGDGTVWVWKADGKGKPVVLRGHEGDVNSASFSADGQRVVTASDDKTARVWPVAIPELQRLLREANSDCLPPKTRQIYLDETDAQAQERYEVCGRSYGRPPFFTAPEAR